VNISSKAVIYVLSLGEITCITELARQISLKPNTLIRRPTQTYPELAKGNLFELPSGVKDNSDGTNLVKQG